jgi:hypothetical protein
MNTSVIPPLQCQLLCACCCAYNIVYNETKNTFSYCPPCIDPYGTAIGWTDIQGLPTTPAVFAGGLNDIDAALVGIIDLNINGAETPAIVIAFRGTLAPGINIPSITDWLQDFVAYPISVPGEGEVPGKVHIGFFNAVNKIFDVPNGIWEEVNALHKSNPNLPLYITGHSKGGAMASLCAALIHFQKPSGLQPSAVYTFAAPIAGDKDFVAGFPPTIPVTRYENYLDIVPFLPPSHELIEALKNAETGILKILGAMFAHDADWNYTPLGTLIYIDEDGIAHDPFASNPCMYDIIKAMEKHHLRWVTGAHSPYCGDEYMSVACPDPETVCYR